MLMVVLTFDFKGLLKCIRCSTDTVQIYINLYDRGVIYFKPVMYDATIHKNKILSI